MMKTNLLDYMKARDLLSKYGLSSIESAYVESAKEAINFSKGKKIVLKVLSDKALHKSKAGLVKADLSGEKEIRDAYEYLEKKARPLQPCKIIAQRMSKGGIEIIIGSNTDPEFGKTVLIGLGGIYVEAFKDVAIRIAPITKYDATDMLQQLRSSSVITSAGARAPMIESILMKVSRMVNDHPEISELDLNPVIITEEGYDIVDIRVLE